MHVFVLFCHLLCVTNSSVLSFWQGLLGGCWGISLLGFLLENHIAYMCIGGILYSDITDPMFFFVSTVLLFCIIYILILPLCSVNETVKWLIGSKDWFALQQQILWSSVLLFQVVTHDILSISWVVLSHHMHKSVYIFCLWCEKCINFTTGKSKSTHKHQGSRLMSSA